MSIYKKNSMIQLKDTFDIMLDDMRDLQYSENEIFQLAKEYEIGIWKKQIEEYKLRYEDYEYVDLNNAIKICKNMIKELSKLSIEEVMRKHISF